MLNTIKYMNIGTARILHKLNKLLKNNNQHKEDLLSLYHFIKEEPCYLGEMGVTQSLYICYNSLKLLSHGLEKYPTDIKYVYLNGKSRIIQALALLTNTMSPKLIEKMNNLQIEQHKIKIKNKLNNIGLTSNEIEIVLEANTALEITSRESIFREPNNKIKELIHEWVLGSYYIEKTGLIGISRYWKQMYTEANNEIYSLDKVLEYIENELHGMRELNGINNNEIVKEMVKDLDNEVANFYELSKQGEEGEEGKLKCLEKMRVYMRAEMYISPGETIL